MNTIKDASQNDAHMRQFIAHGMTAHWRDGAWVYSNVELDRLSAVRLFTHGLVQMLDIPDAGWLGLRAK